MRSYASQDSAKPSEARSKFASTLAVLKPYIWPSDRPGLRAYVVLALLALVMGKVFTVMMPYAYKWATDALDPQAPVSNLWLASPLLMVVAYGVARLLSNGFNQIRDALFAPVGQHAVRGLANRTFAHLHNLSLRFHLQRRTGGLSRVIERGATGIETIVRLTILMGVPTLVEFLLTAAIIGHEYNMLYVAVIAVTVVAYVWFSIVASNWRIRIRRDMNDADTESMSKAVDSLLNYETVKYFNNEALEKARYDVSTAKYEKAATKTFTSLAWLNLGQAVIFTLGMGAVMLMSAREVMAGQQTIGHFVMINALMAQLAIPLNMIGTLYREITTSVTDMDAMFTLLDEPAEVTDRPDAKTLKVEKAAVVFKDVVFAYDPARPILKGVSFEVPAGKTVAIVGPSGAGKSTLSRLLFRFYDVKGGAIEIDGQDIREVTQASLRKAIGMVPQDTVLFNDTVAYNIGYGRAGATEAEIHDAAERAQIAGFIASLPLGYDTEVGERGLKLSGGEKQRVAIARTLLKAPPILILDEATSALDTHTEREIQASLDEVSQNRTTLVIAHRLSTVVGADEILVLKDGVVAERGRHNDLMALGGLYFDMWEKQKAADAARETLAQVGAV
ncbi:ABCB family ABC transporter ATP-binding protein/permease [Asticcacaulis tiandongensis]|uniref:ABCB family ABC transporter ATP-binding protein/permease n=1 Tax=Asticcacaulis tiandongensis TaxID=2565365 RepID=UPI0011271DA0|nr:ABC transporter ATP-binding protein/permease [Asticcacaulis tiandongensis]